jgi:hypothetical protein
LKRFPGFSCRLPGRWSVVARPQAIAVTPNKVVGVAAGIDVNTEDVSQLMNVISTFRRDRAQPVALTSFCENESLLEEPDSCGQVSYYRPLWLGSIAYRSENR